jgi:hypothetical protein
MRKPQLLHFVRPVVAAGLLSVGGAVTLAAGDAHAADPAFVFAEPDEVAEVVWHATAQAGVVSTSGNSQTVTGSGGAELSRHDGKNRVVLTANALIANSRILTANDLNGNDSIDNNELQRESKTTAKNWSGRLRYDRFLAPKSSVYVTGVAAADEIAGKEFFGGVQAGFGQLAFKDDMHEIAVELGYDLTYENYLGSAVDDVYIHSLRGFVGYRGVYNKWLTGFASGEVLFNLNSLNVPPGDVDAFSDTRVNARAGFTAKLLSSVSLRFSFTARYDHRPAPLAAFALPFGNNFVPLAETLDTITEAAVVINFL